MEATYTKWPTFYGEKMMLRKWKLFMLFIIENNHKDVSGIYEKYWVPQEIPLKWLCGCFLCYWRFQNPHSRAHVTILAHKMPWSCSIVCNPIYSFFNCYSHKHLPIKSKSQHSRLLCYLHHTMTNLLPSISLNSLNTLPKWGVLFMQMIRRLYGPKHITIAVNKFYA